MVLSNGFGYAPWVDHKSRPAMRTTSPRAFLLATLLVLACLATAPAAAEVEVYKGLCDASAGFAVGQDHFVVIGDERNVLTLYRSGKPKPVRQFKLGKFLGAKDESDLEGAAQTGDRVYIVSSHGRNADGKFQERRHRFFAVEMKSDGSGIRFKGMPYTKLLDDLLAASQLARLNLNAASARAPESKDGLNIEGLAAADDGALLIGFRNPLVDGKAIVVPLVNPNDVIHGKQAAFGQPALLDLGRRGIRSIERVGNAYLIVAGPTADDGTFALFRWAGGANDAPTPWEDDAIRTLRPEALFAIPGTTQVRILSDDGQMPQGGARCKDLPPRKQSFRSTTVKL